QLVPSVDSHITVGDLYASYRAYCLESGCHAVTKRNFTHRLRDMGIIIERKATGMVVCLEKNAEKNVEKNGASGAFGTCNDPLLPD
ncbi:MAG: hypothetical protein PHT65_10605, partial [Proteiniphilum sp.]|nr:hypothetical protein [Proteiniphilum sp.]